jgi:ATP-dependent helicase/DNAse subunit B
VRHVLEIPVLDRPEEITEISPIDRGSLVHSILERFMVTVREIKKEPEVGEPWTADHKKLLMEIAEEEFKKVETLGITGKPLLWKVAQHEIREDLSVFLEKDSKLRAENMSRPVEIERKFGLGKKGGYPPVVLTTKDGHQISFRGIIDRVDADASRSRLWVMDYKTGSTYPYKDMKEDNLLGAGRHLQLPVYALAVRNQFGGMCDVKAMYWFVTTKGNFEMKTVALSEVEEDLGEIVRIIASGIERGLFPANPGISGESNDNCTYCDYECICPANCDIAWERKSQDPQLSEYVGMSRKQDAEEEED